MDIVPIVKSLTGLVTSLGAGAVVGNAIKATTPDNLKLVSKIFVAVGSVALSTVAGDLAANYVEGQIQDLVDNVRTSKAAAKGERLADEEQI